MTKKQMWRKALMIGVGVALNGLIAPGILCAYLIYDGTSVWVRAVVGCFLVVGTCNSAIIEGGRKMAKLDEEVRRE